MAGGARSLRFVPAALAAMIGSGCAHAGAAASEDGLACLAGAYDGGQTEIASGLTLGPDGRFTYRMSYGALDEQGRGRWEASGERILLTSDPVTAPEFAFLGEDAASDGQLRIELDLPQSLSRQYFDARIELASGKTMESQLDEDGLTINLAEGDQPVSVTLLLPLFGLESAPYAMTRGNGGIVHARFDPNDLGLVAFTDKPLMRDKGDLLMERHGRELRFQPFVGGCTVDQAR